MSTTSSELTGKPVSSTSRILLPGALLLCAPAASLRLYFIAVCARLVRACLGETAVSESKVESGNPLVVLGVQINLSDEGVTFCPWRKPWAFRAELDGVALGSFSSAAAAAVAVAQFRWVEANPCL